MSGSSGVVAGELEQARKECERTGRSARVYQDLCYRTLTSWSRERRVIGKAEHLPRGDMENRIKEQQMALFADRTSAQAMRANQLRLYFASFAYVLLEILQRWGLSRPRRESWYKLLCQGHHIGTFNEVRT